MITKSYTDISIQTFYEIFFQLLNVLQKDSNKITKKQIRLLIEFLLLNDQEHKFTRFSKNGKLAVQKAFKEKYNKTVNMQQLHQFCLTLKKKGIIYEDSDRVKYINKQLKETLNSALKSENPVEFIFKLKIAK